MAIAQTVKTYIIQHPKTSLYFECDFAGWSWSENKDKCKKFRSKEKALEFAGFLNLPESAIKEL